MRTKTSPTIPLPVHRYVTYTPELGRERALLFQAANACAAAKLFALEMTRLPTFQEIINCDGYDHSITVTVEQEGTEHAWDIQVELTAYVDNTVLDHSPGAPRAWE